MARGVFQATVVDDEGNVVPSASIQVAAESDGSLPQLYDAITDGNSLGNPFNADANGFFQFYVGQGSYRVTATLDAFEREWRHVAVAPMTVGDFTATLSGFSGTAPTGTIQWKISGGWVTLFAPTAITGTSNQLVMSMTGIPDYLLPSADLAVPCCFLEYDSSTVNFGFAAIDVSEEEINFHCAIAHTVGSNDHIRATDAFPTSGTKGIPAGWSMSYPLV